MTLSDLVLLPCLHQYLSVAMEIGDQSFLGQMPKILLWYNKMMTVPFISETFSRFGICALTFGDVDSDRINSEALIAVCSKQQILKSRRTLKTNMRRDAPLLINKLKSSGIEVKMDKHPNDKIKLSWSDLPEDVQPIQGTVTEERSQRKCQQIENIVSAVTTIALPGHTIVDFCSGSGHVGITLAYLLPECHIALVENKAESLQRAEKRVKNLKLTNITLYNGNLDYYTAKFDIGVSLHACGVATDMVLDKCIQCNAAFVSAPCCYGSVHTTHVITYPRSQKMRNELTEEEYILLGHSADQTPWQFQSEIAKQGKTSMALIDFDRAEAAREKGYNVSVCTMEPPTCSPKNDLLIGIPVNLSC
uniref:Glutathione S-transferase C-terminal domain-containing protein-like n=1 Tax=Saccoglossus kowalevskii TaxID=10224 RepID=A0ABM0GV10_SACKO|nr:PREDICTED: glutathione S-transferase C-terminal domain-containing protein-like [Saccoglossus kowalevskii]